MINKFDSQADGLIGCWLLNSNAPPINLVGINVKSTINGTPVLSSGRFGKAINFSYNSINPQYINTNQNIADNLSNFSVCAWIRSTQVPTAYNDKVIIAKITNEDYGEGWHLSLKGTGGITGSIGGIVFSIQDSGGAHWNSYYTNIAYNDGKDHLVIATLSGGPTGTIAIYIDGIAVAITNNSSGTLPTTFTNSYNISIAGDLNITPPTLYAGNIRDARIYNRALRAEEVTDLYIRPRGLYIVPNRIINYSISEIWNLSITETGSSSDTINGYAIFTAIIAETGSALDTNSANNVYLSSINESLNSVDTINGYTTFSNSITEIGSVIDNIDAAINSFASSIVEIGNALDIVSCIANFQVDITELGSATESTTYGYIVSITESSNIIDTSNGIFIVSRSQIESATANDIKSSYRVYSSSISEHGNAIDLSLSIWYYYNSIIEKEYTYDLVSIESYIPELTPWINISSSSQTTWNATSDPGIIWKGIN